MKTMTKPKLNIHIRWLIVRDMPEVLQIDKLSFELAWEEEYFNYCLRQSNCIGMVAEHEEKIVGFMVYEVMKYRFDMIRFSVHPNWRRQGVGSKMINNLVTKLTINRRPRIAVEINENNLEGHLFARAMRFRAISIIRQLDGQEDMYRFVLSHTGN